MAKNPSNQQQTLAPLILKTIPLPHGHQPTTWLKMGLRDCQFTFQAIINDQQVLLQVQNTSIPNPDSEGGFGPCCGKLGVPNLAGNSEKDSTDREYQHDVDAGSRLTFGTNLPKFTFLPVLLVPTIGPDPQFHSSSDSLELPPHHLRLWSRSRGQQEHKPRMGAGKLNLRGLKAKQPRPGRHTSKP